MTVELFVDKKGVKFVWWDLSKPEMKAMFAEIMEVGLDNVRLEWWPEHEDGPGRFVVVDEGRASSEDRGKSYNISQFCPPICPDED